MSAISDDGVYYTRPPETKTLAKQLDEMRKDNKELSTRVIKLLKDKRFEELLRDEHKGLQNAWDQYQIMLKLVQGE